MIHTTLSLVLALGVNVTFQPTNAEPPAAPGPAAPETKPDAAEPGLLGGPKVVSKPAAATLVERDMAGKLVRLERRPEAAAVDRLGLSKAEREPVDKVLTERLAKVTKLLTDNQAMFLKIQNARIGNAKREEIAPLMAEFRPIAAPLISPSLGDQVAAALPESKRDEFRRLVGEYNTAAANEDAAEGRTGAEPPGRRAAPADAAVRRTEMNLLLREMGRVLNTIVTERRRQTEEMVRAVDASVEQQAEIQKILRDPSYGEGLERTAEQRADIRRRIASVLTPEQQRKLAEFMRAQRGEEMPPR